MGLSVRIGRKGFAVGTKVRVVADGALVADTSDIGFLRLGTAQRTVTVDTIMAHSFRGRDIDGLVKWSESVAGMNIFGVQNAAGAEVPIRAVQAFVADTVDMLERYQLAGIGNHLLCIPYRSRRRQLHA